MLCPCHLPQEVSDDEEEVKEEGEEKEGEVEEVKPEDETKEKKVQPSCASHAVFRPGAQQGTAALALRLADLTPPCCCSGLQKKKVKEVSHEWQLVNKQKPIWMRSPEEVPREEYNAFYKALTNDWEEPLAYKHFAGEGVGRDGDGVASTEPVASWAVSAFAARRRMHLRLWPHRATHLFRRPTCARSGGPAGVQGGAVCAQARAL